MENSSYIRDKAKYAQELERYERIIKHFENRKSRVNVNIGYLNDIREWLFNHIKDEFFYKGKYTELYNRLNPLLLENLDNKLTSIETSRKEKKKCLVDQFIGELI